MTAAVVVTFAFSLMECSKATMDAAKTPAESPAADDAPRISLADAKKAYEMRGALFIDTRPESAYKNAHIKGAHDFPQSVCDFPPRSHDFPPPG